MALPTHLLIKQISPCLSPIDQWSLACMNKEIHDEFLHAYPDFIETWSLETRVIQKLIHLETILRRFKQPASLCFFSLQTNDTFTLRWERGVSSLYVYEARKGRYIYPKLFKSSDEARVFFNTHILLRFKSRSVAPKVLIRNEYSSQRARKVFNDAVNALLDLLEKC